MPGESRRIGRVAVSALVSCALIAAVAILRNPLGEHASRNLVVDAAPIPAGDSGPPAEPTTVAPPAVPPTAAPTTVVPAPRASAAAASPKAPTVTVARPPSPTTTAPKAVAQASVPPPAGAAGHYAFLAHDGDRPMRYDPCTPIHYVVNPAQAPSTGLADLQEAVRRISAVTGLTFVYDGLTDEVPMAHRGMAANPRYPHGWPPVLVGWVERSQTDLFKGTEVGEGGSTWYGVPGSEVYVTGVVAVDTARDDTLVAGFGGSSTGALLMHELAHVVGLDHVDDPTQIMYPTVTTKPAEFGAGDLTGLGLLGRSSGCLPEPVPPWGV